MKCKLTTKRRESVKVLEKWGVKNLSESEIRAYFREAGYKLCKLAERDGYRVYSMKDREFCGSYNSIYTLEELCDIAEKGNYLQFLAMI